MSPRLTEGQKWYVARKLIQGLHFLHSQRMCHLDLKGANVMINMDQGRPIQVKIIDFGFARFLHSGKNSFSKKGLGTVNWMAPEAFSYDSFLDYESLTNNADIWSYGGILICFWANGRGTTSTATLLRSWDTS